MTGTACMQAAKHRPLRLVNLRDGQALVAR